MSIITTSQLCDLLKVSRSWVHQYLRDSAVDPKDIKERDIKTLRTVWYDTEKVLKWFNENAEFSSQTEQVDWASFVPKKFIDVEMRAVEKLYDPILDALSYQKAQLVLLEQTLPEDILVRLYPKTRDRGFYDWIPVSAEIEALDKMYTIKDILRMIDKNSTEIAYRHIFKYSYTRVSVAGHTWFIENKDYKNMFWPLRLSIAPRRRKKKQ